MERFSFTGREQRDAQALTNHPHQQAAHLHPRRQIAEAAKTATQAFDTTTNTAPTKAPAAPLPGSVLKDPKLTGALVKRIPKLA